MEKKYVIVGAGGLGREVAGGVEMLIAKEGGVLLGFLDDSSDALGSKAGHYPPVLGAPRTFSYSSEITLLLGVGDPESKMQLVTDIEKRGGRFGTFVHPTAIAYRSARVGRGCVLCRDANVSADAIVGEFVLLNGFSGIAHDCRVGAGTTISSYVDICGRAEIGNEVFIGTHASVLPGVRVGDRARIGAGSIVMRNVKRGTVVYQPAAKTLFKDE